MYSLALIGGIPRAGAVGSILSEDEQRWRLRVYARSAIETTLPGLRKYTRGYRDWVSRKSNRPDAGPKIQVEVEAGQKAEQALISLEDTLKTFERGEPILGGNLKEQFLRWMDGLGTGLIDSDSPHSYLAQQLEDVVREIVEYRGVSW